MIAGLGNPGTEYAKTRHNVGYRIVERVAERHGLPRWRRRGNRLETRGAVSAREVTLVKPVTFMNLSGEALAALRREAPFEPAELLVCYDDLALPLGRIRLRPEGSHGGHNGMRSVIARLGTREFPRLRVGIAPADAEGRALQVDDGAEYVLEPFGRAERADIEEAIDRAAEAIEVALAEDLKTAMNRFNRTGG